MEVSEREFQRVAKRIGTRLRELRKASGLTQAGLEERAGVYDVGAIERGEQNPTLLTMVRLAKTLRVNLLDLFAISESRTAAQGIREEITGLVSQEDLATQKRALELIKLFLK